MERTSQAGKEACAKALKGHGEFRELKNGYCCWSEEHGEKVGVAVSGGGAGGGGGIEGGREAPPTGI